MCVSVQGNSEYTIGKGLIATQPLGLFMEAITPASTQKQMPDTLTCSTANIGGNTGSSAILSSGGVLKRKRKTATAPVNNNDDQVADDCNSSLFTTDASQSPSVNGCNSSSSTSSCSSDDSNSSCNSTNGGDSSNLLSASSPGQSDSGFSILPNGDTATLNDEGTETATESNDTLVPDGDLAHANGGGGGVTPGVGVNTSVNSSEINNKSGEANFIASGIKRRKIAIENKTQDISTAANVQGTTSVAGGTIGDDQLNDQVEHDSTKTRSVSQSVHTAVLSSKIIPSSSSPPPRTRSPQSPSVTPKTPTTEAVSSPSANSVVTPGPSKSFPRGCLLLTRSGRRKSVRWLPDESITQVKEFDSTLDERTNVFREALQASQKSLFEGKNAEGHAFLHNKEPFDSSSAQQTPTIPLVPWTLIPIDLPASVTTVTPGANSNEKIVQMERQKVTLADLYLSKELVPPSPKEPDEQTVLAATGLSKSIPLDDLENPGVINDYSTSGWPVPHVAILPSSSSSSYLPTVNIIDHNHGHGDLMAQANNIHQPQLAHHQPPVASQSYGQPLVSSSYTSPNLFVNSSYNFHPPGPQPQQMNSHGQFQSGNRVVSSYYYNHSPSPHQISASRFNGGTGAGRKF